jgi:hypothetical protein
MQPARVAQAAKQVPAEMLGTCRHQQRLYQPIGGVDTSDSQNLTPQQLQQSSICPSWSKCCGCQARQLQQHWQLQHSSSSGRCSAQAPHKRCGQLPHAAVALPHIQLQRHSSCQYGITIGAAPRQTTHRQLNTAQVAKTGI